MNYTYTLLVYTTPFKYYVECKHRAPKLKCSYNATSAHTTRKEQLFTLYGNFHYRGKDSLGDVIFSNGLHRFCCIAKQLSHTCFLWDFLCRQCRFNASDDFLLMVINSPTAVGWSARSWHARNTKSRASVIFSAFLRAVRNSQDPRLARHHPSEHSSNAAQPRDEANVGGLVFYP